MRTVLVVRLSAMGDVVQSLGAVRALIAARPDLDVHQVVQRPFAPLLEDVGLASVVEHDRQGGVAAFWRTVRAVRALRADVALDLQGNWKSAAIARASGARRVLGGTGASRQERASGILLAERVRAPSPHPAAVATALVRRIAPDARVEAPRLEAGPDEVAREAEAVRRAGIDPGRPFRVLVFVDPADARALRLAAIEREVGRAPLPVLLVAGPGESGARPPEGLPVLRHARGEVRRLLALGEVVRRAGGDVFGPDTGATHVLAATGAPTLAAFGPHDPSRTAPLAASVLRRPDPPTCMPCRRRVCRHPDGPVCMDVTTAEAVRTPAAPR